jgi:hypothetical protein
MLISKKAHLFGIIPLFLRLLCSWSLAPTATNSRRSFIRNTAAALVPAVLVSRGQAALAEEDVVSVTNEKLGLSNAELKSIVRSDLVEKQFLVTGDLTRSIYKPTATFTDEIDTYGMDQWMKGTQKLFVGSKSDVRLVGDVEVSPEKVEFRFDEDLMFNIPFKPVVSLSGKVVLTRDETGFITSYREFWDQDVATVLRTAKF